MSQKLVPNKNHKKFTKELCGLINAYSGVENIRNEEEVRLILKERLPLIFNNFDKNHVMFEPTASILTDALQSLGTVMKFIKEEA